MLFCLLTFRIRPVGWACWICTSIASATTFDAANGDHCICIIQKAADVQLPPAPCPLSDAPLRFHGEIKSQILRVIPNCLASSSCGSTLPACLRIPRPHREHALYVNLKFKLICEEGVAAARQLSVANVCLLFVKRIEIFFSSPVCCCCLHSKLIGVKCN